jgi:hypothetical protein
VAHPAPFAQAFSDISVPFRRQLAGLVPSGLSRRFGIVLVVLNWLSLPAFPLFPRPSRGGFI